MPRISPASYLWYMSVVVCCSPDTHHLYSGTQADESLVAGTFSLLKWEESMANHTLALKASNQKWKKKGGGSVSRSVVSDSLKSHGLGSHKAPLSMEFSRQEYWSGYPFPSLGDLPDPGIELGSPALQADSLPSQPPEKALPTRSETYLLLTFRWPKQVTWSPLSSTGNL